MDNVPSQAHDFCLVYMLFEGRSEDFFVCLRSTPVDLASWLEKGARPVSKQIRLSDKKASCIHAPLFPLHCPARNQVRPD